MMNRRSILKRIWIPVLLAALALPTLPAFAYGSPDGEPLYRAKTIGESRLLTGPDGDTVLYLKKDLRIDILAVDPCYVYVRAKNREGYLYRSRLKDVKPYDPETTPPYGVEVFRYMTTAGMPTPILAEPDPTSEELITLYEGARFAIIGFEDGWAKVIFKRQWGWIEADRLTQLVQVRASVDEPGMSAPLAVYTSYYGIQDTEANIGRMANIGNCCEKLSAIVLQPGDTFDFNSMLGPYSSANGYHVAPVLTDGKLTLNYGGGTCQVSSTLYNVALQLPGITIVKRRAHGANGASYLPHGVDAAVGNSTLNLIFRNDYDFPIRMDASAQDGALYICMWRADEKAALPSMSLY